MLQLSPDDCIFRWSSSDQIVGKLDTMASDVVSQAFLLTTVHSNLWSHGAPAVPAVIE